MKLVTLFINNSLFGIITFVPSNACIIVALDWISTILPTTLSTCITSPITNCLESRINTPERKFIIKSCKAKPTPKATAAITEVKSIPATFKPAVIPRTRTIIYDILPVRISISDESSSNF